MKKFIVLLLTILLCGCSIEKPAETLSSMQTEPTASETAVAEMPETTTKTDSEVPKPETSETAESKYAEFDVNYWVDFATTYALQIGLEIDPTASDCWDDPTTANADCIYLERDLTHRLDRYKSDEDITAVNIWAESLGNGNYLIYIAYA